VNGIFPCRLPTDKATPPPRSLLRGPRFASVTRPKVTSRQDPARNIRIREQGEQKIATRSRGGTLAPEAESIRGLKRKIGDARARAYYAMNMQYDFAVESFRSVVTRRAVSASPRTRL